MTFEMSLFFCNFYECNVYCSFYCLFHFCMLSTSLALAMLTYVSHANKTPWIESDIESGTGTDERQVVWPLLSPLSVLERENNPSAGVRIGRSVLTICSRFLFFLLCIEFDSDKIWFIVRLSNNGFCGSTLRNSLLCWCDGDMNGIQSHVSPWLTARTIRGAFINGAVPVKGLLGVCVCVCVCENKRKRAYATGECNK